MANLQLLTIFISVKIYIHSKETVMALKYSAPIFGSNFIKKRASVKNRLLHRWTAMLIALPILLVIITGIFLQVREPIDWIQPPTLQGSQKYQPVVALEQVLNEVKSVPEMKVNDWSDIKLLDLQPKKGIVKVSNYRELETQVDATTGEVLQTARRRNNFIVKIHDFSAWNARLWFGLPVDLGFLAIFTTGICLAVKISFVRIKSAAKGLVSSKKIAELNNDVFVSDRSTDISSISNKDGRPRRLRLKSLMLTYHYWLSWIVIIPWAFVISSGLLLQVRYEVPWVMPVQQQGQGQVPQVEFVQALSIAREYTEYGVRDWSDVWRMYVDPDRGITTIRAKNRQEFQIDSATGDVLQIATRRTDWLEDIHEGKWMGLNLWLFLPVHILSLILWLTGTIVAYSR